MFGEYFKQSKPIDFEKPLKAYILKNYGKYKFFLSKHLHRYQHLRFIE
jgi:hypothetical protein